MQILFCNPLHLLNLLTIFIASSVLRWKEFVENMAIGRANATTCAAFPCCVGIGCIAKSA